MPAEQAKKSKKLLPSRQSRTTAYIESDYSIATSEDGAHGQKERGDCLTKFLSGFHSKVFAGFDATAGQLAFEKIHNPMMLAMGTNARMHHQPL
jgi:hypothetical protein